MAGIRTFLRLGAALALTGIVTTGCNKQGSTKAPSAAAQPHDEAPSEVEASTCRNWADLDLASLEPIANSAWSDTLEKVWHTLLAKHYDPTLACLDWPALRTQYATALVDAKTDEEAYSIMNRLLGELGQSHLAIVPPRKQVVGEPRTGERFAGASVPMKVRLIEGKLVVTKPAVDGIRSGIPSGAALSSIDDHEIAPMLEEQRSVWKREVELAAHVERIAASWLSCEPGAKRTITYLPFGKDKPASKTVKCHERKVERTSMGNLQDVPIEVEQRLLGPNKQVGYLYFNVWMLPLVPKIEQAIAELRAGSMKALIIDLRGNPGGVGMMVVPLARQLLSESGTLGVMRMREAEQHFKFTAGSDPFGGPVAILVDAGTGSTSEIFAQGMRDLDRVQIFGSTPSQGAALPSLIEELPGGAILQYVVADYQSPRGVAVEGQGVSPDVVVEETQADFAAGKDPVLEAAIAALIAQFQ